MPTIPVPENIFTVYNDNTKLSNIIRGTSALECLSLESIHIVESRYKEFNILDTLFKQSGIKITNEDYNSIKLYNLTEDALETNWFNRQRILDVNEGKDTLLLDFIIVGKENMLHAKKELKYVYKHVPWTQEQIDKETEKLQSRLYNMEDVERHNDRWNDATQRNFCINPHGLITNPQEWMQERNAPILKEHHAKIKRMTRCAEPPPPDTYTFDCDDESKTYRLLFEEDNVFIKQAKSALKSLLPYVPFEASAFQPFDLETVRVAFEPKKCLDPILFWWYHCIDEAIWWPDANTNMILCKDIMYRHFLTYSKSYKWSSKQERVMESQQLFWEAFYKIQPIVNKNIRRYKRQADGTTKRVQHIRLPKWTECQKRLSVLLKGKGIYCIFLF